MLTKSIKKKIVFINKLCRKYIKYKNQILFLLILVTFIYLRFYELSSRAIVGWDQADSAWAAKSIIVDSLIRLEGVPIKGNASMFMGPLYYYLITPFYFFTRLDMIASPIFAGVISIISFLIFYFITKKLLDIKVALLASIFYVFSISVIMADRVQAAYVITPILSYIIFYCLYKFITGNERYILYVAAAIGFGFHIHFTTIFYVPIIFLTLPFFPKTRKSLFYLLLSILVFFIFLSPILFSIFFTKHRSGNSIISYLGASYHGLHFTRVLQLSYDAFISFQSIFQFKLIRPFIFFLLPTFAVISYVTRAREKRNEVLLILYLISLWILVPWLVLSTYNGELTDYYFSLPRNLGFAMIAYIIVFIYQKNNLPLKLFISMLLVFYSLHNLYLFSQIPPGNYLGTKMTAKNAIRNKETIEFKDRDPLFYNYYIYTAYKDK